MKQSWIVAALVAALAATGGCKKDKKDDGGAGAEGSGSALVASGSSASGSGSSSGSSSASGSASGSGSGSAAIVVPPYTPAADVPAEITAAIAATDRTDADRALDAGRKPGEVLAFFRIAPGQKIGELFAGGGATTELVARIVGDKGQVFAQNTTEILEKFARKPWQDRAAKPIMKNVVGVERAADDPFPPEAKDLDAVICVLNYHDFVWQKVDRAKMNKVIFDRLKKGGVYGIVDHSAEAGSGERDVETLHRIDEEVVKKEILAAGFKLDAESDVLRVPDDKRDWNASPRQAGDRRGHSDRFVLRFVKP
jgi:predicted methyltransferase